MRDFKTSWRRRSFDKAQDRPFGQVQDRTRRAMQEFILGQEVFGKIGSFSVGIFRMARKASAKLFIYGSLRVDSNNPFKRYLRNHSTFAATGSFTGKLYDLGEFPAAIPSANPQDQVSGEVRLLKDPQAILQKLDRYEGCDLPQPLFIRRLAEIAVENQNVLTAWIYLYNRSIKGCPQIVSGDYLQHLEESQLCSTTSDLQS